MARLRFFCGFVFVLCLTLAATAFLNAAPAQAQAVTLAPGITKQRVTFPSHGLTLVGYLYTPSSGTGPFPGIIWNHGSEKDPGTTAEFDGIANVFVPAGYIVFNPVREGHGDSQGQNIDDQFMAEKQAHGLLAAENLFVQLMEGPQLNDQLAGAGYLRGVPHVDSDRMAVVGCSYGGIQTLLGAEAGIYDAAVALSPAAESWAGNIPLQTRLIKAVDGIYVPTFLMQPEKDADVSSGYRLGQEFQKLGKSYGFEIFPPYGSDAEQGHCFGGAIGNHIWAPDVLNFLKNVMP